MTDPKRSEASPRKLALGSAQFGLDYGISNRTGRTPLDVARAIVERALSQGLDLIDTAPGYGVSEEILGRVLERVLERDVPRIVTKTPHFPEERITREHASTLRESLATSLDRLKRDRVYGLLIHAADDLRKPGGEHLYQAMCDLRHEGLVERVGASLYTVDQLRDLRSRYELDLLQVPINVLDQRLLRSGELDALSDGGVEIHARSVFLQGALLMEVDDLPSVFNRHRASLKRYRALLHDRGWSPVEAALGFVLALTPVDRVVCGVNTLEQWEELARVSPRAIDASQLFDFGIADERALNPSRWNGS